MRMYHEDSTGFRSVFRSLSGCGGAGTGGEYPGGAAGPGAGESFPDRPARQGYAKSSGPPGGPDRSGFPIGAGRQDGGPRTDGRGIPGDADRSDPAGFAGDAGRPCRPGFPGSAKRAGAALALLLVFGVVAGAQDLSLSLASWRFFPNRNAYRPSGEGLHASVGLVAGINPRLEAALSVVGRLTPNPADNLFLAMGLGYSIATDRYVDRSTPTLHLNAIAEAGVLAGVHSLTSGGTPSFSTHLYARFTPIALGSLYYGRRDRLYTVGLQYDISAAQVSVILSVIGADIRLSAKR